MKRIFQWIILYIIIFGIVGYFIYNNSTSGNEQITMNETKNIFSSMWKSIRDYSVNKFKEFSKKQLINETTFYKLKPKSCSLELPFRCLSFEITDKAKKTFKVNIKNIRAPSLRIKGMSFSKGIECSANTDIVLKGGKDVNITLENCSVYEKYATINLFYQKEGISTIIHTVNGVITLGSEMDSDKNK